MEYIGYVIFAVGALLTYTSEKILKLFKCEKRAFNIALKAVGFAIAVVGSLTVMGIIKFGG